MQSRRPPIPRKPVLPPQPPKPSTLQGAQAATASPRPQATTLGPPWNSHTRRTRPPPPFILQRSGNQGPPTHDDKPPLSPKPLSPPPLSPSPSSRGRAAVEFSTPPLSPKEKSFGVTLGREGKPTVKWSKPNCWLGEAQRGRRSDGSEKTDSNGVMVVDSEKAVSSSSNPTGPSPNPSSSPDTNPCPGAKPCNCQCLCHHHRPGMRLVWVPVQDEDDGSPTAELGTRTAENSVTAEQTMTVTKPMTTEESQEASRQRDAKNEKSDNGEVKVDDSVHRRHHRQAGPDLLYESMEVPEKPTPPPRPPHLAPGTYIPPQQQALMPPQVPPKAGRPSPDSSPRLNAKAKPCPSTSPVSPSKVGWGTKNEAPSPKSSPSMEHRPLPPIPPVTPRSPRGRNTQARPVLSYMLSPRGCPPPCRRQQSERAKSKDNIYYDGYESYKCTVAQPPPEKADVNLDDFYEWVSTDQEDIPVYLEIQQDSPPERKASQDKQKLKHSMTFHASTKVTDPSRPQAVAHAQVSRANSVGGGEGVALRKNKVEPLASLWQDRPEVKASGVLETLSRREVLLQESMFEVMSSEESYQNSLRVLRDHFLGSRELNDTLVIHDKKRLFSNILQVYEVSERFLADLQDRVNESVVISDLCDIIHNHAQNHFAAYTDYVRDQVYQEKTYSSLMQSNRHFALVMRRLEESPLCKRLPFTSFLLLPFQRITRLKILIQNILKKTEEGSKLEQTCSQALAVVSEIIKDTNTQVGKMKQMEELFSIANMLEFQKLKAVPIVSQTRYLEKQGELLELSKAGSLFNIRLRFLPVYAFLFNDLFVLASKKSPDRYVVIDHAHRSVVQAQAVREDELRARFEHCFCLTLLENHQGQHCERLLKANTESDMHRWIAALPSLTEPQPDQNEKIYTDWDCPQVQCVEQYTGQQADELSLEPTDIINVLRKTKEGWCEGIRLYDGQTGWFPSKNVLEITNEHQRRRNLVEQYRIQKSAAKIAQHQEKKL
ncbi:rho guanine nucleotide exchange factor 15 isoform X2 [Engraulis encrasicolus]|uniref:rho guanine nucleotide exchange factor 15 isoform X2 n=1 Tax=Engraulis encrasicolus TaxID=184585 RepID=UPI002FD05828